MPLLLNLEICWFDAWKKWETNIPPNGGILMVMNPMVQSVKNHLKQIPVNQNWLVVSTHLKTISQNGFIFPKDRDENKKYLSCHHLATHTVPLDPKTMKNESFKA